MGSASIEENAESYGLTKRDPLRFQRRYLAWEADMADPQASPLLAPGLSGLPPALIITAEYDPLRDEGGRDGERLRGSGVSATLSRYHGMIHGFTGMGAVMEQARSPWLGAREPCRRLGPERRRHRDRTPYR